MKVWPCLLFSVLFTEFSGKKPNNNKANNQAGKRMLKMGKIEMDNERRVYGKFTLVFELFLSFLFSNEQNLWDKGMGN